MKPVINIDPDCIPGVFRKRILLTEQNLIEPEKDKPKKKLNNKKVKKATKKKPKIPKVFTDLSHNVTNIGSNSDDKKDQFQSVNDIFGIDYDPSESVKFGSSIMFPIFEKNDTNMTDFMGFTDDDEDLNMAILESLKETQNKPIKNIQNKKPKDENIESFYYWVCLDLRVYGPDPSLPVYVENKELYLNLEQIENIKKNWRKVESDDTNFMQDLTYYKLETRQLYKDNLFNYN